MGDATDEHSTTRSTGERKSTLRTLFDRRSPSNGGGTIWRRRITNARAAAIVVVALATASATVIGALRHATAGAQSPASPEARVDSTLVELDHRTTSLERFRDTLSDFMETTRRAQDSARSDQRMNFYMLCILTRRIDPASTPPGCSPVSVRSR